MLDGSRARYGRSLGLHLTRSIDGACRRQLKAHEIALSIGLSCRNMQ